MQKLKILLFSLKESKVFCVSAENGNIDAFVYELFTKFKHTVQVNTKSIVLDGIQENSSTLRDQIGDLIKKYATKLPQIHNFKNFLSNLNDNEKFYVIELVRELTNEEVSKLESTLMYLNMPNFDIVKHMQQRSALFKSIWENYNMHITNDKKKNHIGEPSKKKRVCRYCDKTMETGATFKNEAHAISEALGNKTVIFNEECDDCNSYFDQNIERDFITYLSLFRTFFGILNKSNKIPSVVGKNFKYRKLDSGNVELKYMSDDNIDIDETKPPTKIPLIFNEMLTLQNIYKTLVKYALSIVPNIDKQKFENTIKWLRNPTYKETLPKVGILAAYTFYKEHPNMIVYIRNNQDKTIPYAVGEFHFTFLTFAFIIPTFSEGEQTFINQNEFEFFWQTFKHYYMCKEFNFELFTDSVKRNVQFTINFQQNAI